MLQAIRVNINFRFGYLVKADSNLKPLVQDNILRELLNRQIQNPDNILALCRILKQLLVKEHLSNTKKKIILRIPRRC